MTGPGQAGKMTAQGTRDGRPQSSPLMKLAMRPKNNPADPTVTMRSVRWSKRIFADRLNQARAKTTPTIPPWLAMPPSQTRKKLSGSFHSCSGWYRRNEPIRPPSITPITSTKMRSAIFSTGSWERPARA